MYIILNDKWSNMFKSKKRMVFFDGGRVVGVVKPQGPSPWHGNLEARIAAF
jgi:hypothetical protein